MFQVLRSIMAPRNWPVLLAIGVLCAFGLLSVGADSEADGRKQILFMAVGCAVLGGVQAVGYQALVRWAWGLYLLSLAGVFYTVIAGFFASRYRIPVPLVHEVNGAFLWIQFGAFSLQPAELVKIGFVMTMARYLRYRSNYRTLKGLLPPFLLAAVPLVLILRQPDLGTALVFLPALFAMLFAAGARWGHLLLVVMAGVALAPLLWFSGACDQFGNKCPICPNVPGLSALPQFVKHYQRARVYAMFSDDATTMNAAGYQQQRAIIAMGSGGLQGKGLGNIPVGRTVPEAHNDMVYALIGEQFGFLGSAGVLLACLLLLAGGMWIAMQSREPFGRLTAVGIVALFAGQTFINIMVCLRLMPVTGITLPFISYGGSSLVACFLAVGLLLKISAHRPLVLAREPLDRE